MRRTKLYALGMLATLFVLGGSVAAPAAAPGSAPTTFCRIAALGTLAEGDGFAGFVSDRSGTPRGLWVHRTPDGRLFIGRPEGLSCEQNGALLISIDGTGTFDGMAGLPFRVTIQDRQDPAQVDFYQVVIVTPSGDLLYIGSGHLATGDVGTVLR